MSEKNKLASSTDKGKSAVPPPAPKGPKKAAAHIKVIEDAAKLGLARPESDAPSTAGVEDYENAKAVSRSKALQRDEDIQNVKDLDRWG
jgi:hypothetical protein